VPAEASATRAAASLGTVFSRLRTLAVPLVLTGIMLYVDSLTHSGPALQIVIGVVVAGLVAFGGQILERTGLRAIVEQIPKQFRPILLALVPAIWFAVRAKGTSGAGVPVAIVSIGLVAVISLFGPAIDRQLEGFYERRNRVLPRRLRAVLTVIAPIIVSFVIIHGSLRALPVLFGGTTSSAAAAPGRTGLFVIGTLLSGVLAFLLLREREA
jgi:hypothetical protein